MARARIMFRAQPRKNGNLCPAGAPGRPSASQPQYTTYNTRHRASHGTRFLAPGSLARRRLARVIHHHTTHDAQKDCVPDFARRARGGSFAMAPSWVGAQESRRRQSAKPSWHGQATTPCRGLNGQAFLAWDASKCCFACWSFGSTSRTAERRRTPASNHNTKTCHGLPATSGARGFGA